MYRPFNDKKKDRTWVRRGMNQKEGPYMGENVPPCKQRLNQENCNKIVKISTHCAL